MTTEALVREISHRVHMKDFNDFQIRNLLTLIEFLKSDEIPPPNFNMRTWLSIGEENIWTSYASESEGAYNICGTVACAIGHGPLAGIGFKHNEYWDAYGDRCFCPIYTPQFMFLFGGIWADEKCKLNNTAKGTALRIQWFLDNGLPNDYKSIFYEYADTNSPWLEGFKTSS